MGSKPAKAQTSAARWNRRQPDNKRRRPGAGRHWQPRCARFVVEPGRPVTIILPLDTRRAEKEMVRAGKKAVLGNWERYKCLAEELRCAWPADLSNQDVIDAIRR